MALLSVWPENQVFAALFDKLAYGAISVALNCGVLPRFNVPGRGAKSRRWRWRRPVKPRRMNPGGRAGRGSVASDSERRQAATGNENEPVLT